MGEGYLPNMGVCVPPQVNYGSDGYTYSLFLNGPKRSHLGKQCQMGDGLVRCVKGAEHLSVDQYKEESKVPGGIWRRESNPNKRLRGKLPIKEGAGRMVL
jgi:hypothetical protein